jgi:hypothetical protein
VLYLFQEVNAEVAIIFFRLLYIADHDVYLKCNPHPGSQERGNESCFEAPAFGKTHF